MGGNYFRKKLRDEAEGCYLGYFASGKGHWSHFSSVEVVNKENSTVPGLGVDENMTLKGRHPKKSWGGGREIQT